MAEQEIKVPDLGGMDEVEVIEICVASGDAIEEESTLIVLESDKATMEVPSPSAGVIMSLAVKVGDKVSEGSLVAMLDTESSASVSPDSADEPNQSIPEPKQTEGNEPQTSQSSTNQEPKELNVVVPDLGGIESVEVIELTATIGDLLNPEDPVITLESDKATMEIPSPAAGKLLSFAVAVGDKVNVGDVVAVLMATTNDTSESADKDSVSPHTTEASSTKSEASSNQLTAKNENVSHAQSAVTGGTVHAGPAVRKLARELGVDLSMVTGSGPKQRVLKDDLHNFVKQKMKEPSAVGSIAIQGSNEDFSRFGDIETIALNKIKLATARNMVQSWTTIPQVTQFDEADITELENYRKTKAASMAPEGVKVTPLAFITKAVVAALKAFPNFNSSLSADSSGLVLKNYYNIGVAVDTPEGLLVPNIKGADRKGVVELASAASELAQKARDKKLPMDAMAGTSFTISSLGGIGGTAFTPIVNAPQVAILGVSKAQLKPIWNGQTFEPRLMLPVSVSYDHRVIDGAEAAKFTRYLCEMLSDVRHLLL